MSERERWSPEASASVQAFRDEVDIPVDVDAAWARFEAEAEAEADLEPNPEQARPRWLWPAVFVAAAAAAVLLWGFAGGVSSRATEVAPPVEAPDQVVETGEDTARAVTPTARPAADSVPPRLSEPEAPGSPTSLPRPATSRSRPQAAQPSQDPPSPAEPSRLAEELRLLEAMRRAERAGRHGDALRVVQQHAKAFEHSAFAAEREVVRVRCLCGQGQREAAERARTAFIRRFPTSHLVAQVREPCDRLATPKK